MVPPSSFHGDDRRNVVGYLKSITAKNEYRVPRRESDNERRGVSLSSHVFSAHASQTCEIRDPPVIIMVRLNESSEVKRITARS